MEIINKYNAFIELIQTIIIGSGGLATAILAVWGLWTKLLKPYLEQSKEHRDKLAKVINHIEDIAVELSNVSKELKPNGGGSIKDQIKQIANDVKIIRIERDATFYLAKDPMFKTDGKGYYTSVNTSLCNLIGVNEQELLGLGWLNYISSEDKDRIIDEWENIIESGKELTTFYTLKNPQTSELVPVKCRAVINRTENEIISAIGTLEKTTIKVYRKLSTA